MARLALNAAPTFQAKVGIPVAGGDPVPVVFTFRHRTRTQLDEFIKSRAEVQDIDTFMEMVVGWDLEDEFNRENVERLLENYIGTALATYRVYVDQLIRGREKN